MNNKQIRRQNGWISLFTMSLAFFVTAVSIILINLSISNFRVCNSIAQGVNIRGIKDNFIELARCDLESYSKKLAQDIKKQYSNRSDSELEGIFRVRLVNTFSSNFGKNINPSLIKHFNINSFVLGNSNFDTKDKSILYLTNLFYINIQMGTISSQVRYLIDYNKGDVMIITDTIE